MEANSELMGIILNKFDIFCCVKLSMVNMSLFIKKLAKAKNENLLITNEVNSRYVLKTRLTGSNHILLLHDSYSFQSKGKVQDMKNIWTLTTYKIICHDSLYQLSLELGTVQCTIIKHLSILYWYHQC